MPSPFQNAQKRRYSIYSSPRTEKTFAQLFSLSSKTIITLPRPLNPRLPTPPQHPNPSIPFAPQIKEEYYNFKFRQLGMNFAYFPLREFTQALTVTSKVKSRLEPFIQEMKNYNMQWLFQILIELYQYMTSTDCKICYKFNSLVALKILLDSCEFPIIMLVEVYFLPHIRKIATYQLHSTQKQRGLDYFLVQGFSKVDDIKKLGYNYVRLASEIVSVMSQVKPYRLYGFVELSQPSEYTNLLEIMRAQQWKQYDYYAFYPEDIDEMREIFLLNVKKILLNCHKYYEFLDGYLDKMIRKEYTPKVMDLRKIFESGEVLACNYVLDCLKEMVKENKASIKTNVIKMMTEFVKWGYIKASYIIQCENVFDDLFNMIRKGNSLKSSDRGRYYFREFEGTEEERKNLLGQLIRSLQIWAICIPTNLAKQQKESKCSLLYKELLQSNKLEFPYPCNFKKIRNECEENLQKNKEINKLTMKDLKKFDFDIVQMRRTSSNLEQLMKMDENLSCSIKALIKGVEKYKNAKTEDSSSSSFSSSSSGASWTNTEVQIEGTFKSIKSIGSQGIESYEQLAQDSNKQSHCLNGFKVKGKQQVSVHSIKLSQVIQIREIPNDEISSDDENYTVQCEEKLKVNELRCIARPDKSNKEIKIKINQAKRHNKVEFFEANTHTNSHLQTENEIEVKRARQVLANFNHCGANEQKYTNFVRSFSQIESSKLLHSKDLLLKTNKIQIGFISKLISDYSTELTIFITPFKDLEKLRWNIISNHTVTCTDQTQKFVQISENKQRKILFQCSIHVPYELPRLFLQYKMENKQYQHVLHLPISFNNFVRYSEHLQPLTNPSIIDSPISQINPQYIQPSTFLSFFSDFTYFMLDNRTCLFYGRAQYLNSFFNIYFSIQDRKYLHLKCEIPSEKRQLIVPVQFLMTVLLSILKR